MSNQKECPKCELPLKERKDGSRFCVNGCEIYTAAPHGATFSAQITGDSGGYSHGQRRNPKLEE